MGRYAVIFDQFTFYFTIYVPLPGFVSAEVGKDELRTLMLIVLIVVVCNHPGAMAGFIVHMVAETGRIDHTHIERHFTGVIRSNQHLCLIFPIGQFTTIEQFPVACLCKLNQTVDKCRLVGRGWYVMQYLILLRPVDADIGGCTKVGDFGIKGRQFRHFDKVAETLFLYNLVGYRKLVVNGFFSKNGRPRIKSFKVLAFHLLRTQILKQQVQLSKGVGYGCP